MKEIKNKGILPFIKPLVQYVFLIVVVMVMFSCHKKEDSLPIKKDNIISAIEDNYDILDEINGEINEMHQRFSFYKEETGFTYIDNIKYPPNLDSMRCYLYIGITPENKSFARTVIQYVSNERIGLKNILIQIDSSKQSLIVDVTKDIYQTKETSVFSEWVDLPPSDGVYKLATAIAYAQQVKLTFKGEEKDFLWILPETEITIMRESLYFYNLLKKREELLNNKKTYIQQ